MKIIDSGECGSIECGSIVNYELIEDGVLKIFGIGKMSKSFSFFQGNKNIKYVVVGNEVTSIGERAFEDCTSLVSIEIPNSVIEIGDNAFRGCASLKSIKIPNSVMWIGNDAFAGCTSLEVINVDLSNECYSSDNGVLYNKDKSLLILYPSRKSETSFVIPNSVTDISCTFLGCTSLESIVCLTKLPPMYHCHSSNIPKSCVLKVPKGTKQAYMEHKSWKHIKNIEEFELIKCGDVVNSELKNNGTMVIFGSGEMDDDCTFENDNRIKRVVIKGDITELSENLFKDCRRLRIVEIDSLLEEIADGAFSGCENILSITINSELPPIVGANTLEGVMRTTEIRVPKDSIRYYKAAKVWCEFTNYVAID